MTSGDPQKAGFSFSTDHQMRLLRAALRRRGWARVALRRASEEQIRKCDLTGPLSSRHLKPIILRFHLGRSTHAVDKAQASV